MASLPPRPESPLRDRHDKRYPLIDIDRRGIRPLAPQPRYRDTIPDSDRVYVPQSARRSESDTYIAPPYDRRDIVRRPGEYDHRTFGRDRGRPRGDHPRPYDRGSGPDRRDSRPYSPPSRRPPLRSQRSRSPPYRRPSCSPYQRSPLLRTSRSPYRRSRSPLRRHSPLPFRRPPLSRSRSRSTRKTSISPEKPIKLGNHSISAVSQPHSPYNPPRGRPTSERFHLGSAPDKSVDDALRERHLQQKNPECKKIKDEDFGLVIEANPENPKPDLSATLPQYTNADPLIGTNLEAKPNAGLKIQKKRSPTPPSSYYRPPDYKILSKHESPVPHIIAKEEPKYDSIPSVQDHVQTEVQPHLRDRSLSPPRQPRHAPTGPSRGIPPRGPRIHRNPGPPPFPPPYPTGPRRRYQYGPSSPATYPHPHGSSSTSDSISRPSLPPLPELRRPKPVTHEIDMELARLESHRGHLVADYRRQEKVARRALHELDMATIDLRAAEGRRKIADSQLEKAKTGALGMDAIVSNSPVL